MKQDNLPPLGLVMKVMVVILGCSTIYKAVQEYAMQRAENAPASFLHPIIWEVTGHFFSLLLVPFLYLFIRHFPIAGPRRWLRAMVHIVASLVFSIIDTTLFYEARLWIYHYFDLGPYGYGNAYYRYLYEFQVFLVVYWLFYGGLRLFVYVVENRESRLRTARLEAELNQARLDFLKTQINPHFLFNTLNTISSVMYENVVAADRMISLLSQMLRRTLDRAEQQLVPLRKDVELLELYLEIMKARFGDRLTTRVEVSSGAEEAEIPSFLLQPLVENSIKFNPATGEKIAQVLVRAEIAGSWLELNIEDNGPGLSSTFRPGTGLTNVQKRLEHLYGSKQSFELKNRPEGGLAVTIRVPYSEGTEEAASGQIAPVVSEGRHA